MRGVEAAGGQVQILWSAKSTYENETAIWVDKHERVADLIPHIGHELYHHWVTVNAARPHIADPDYVVKSLAEEAAAHAASYVIHMEEGEKRRAPAHFDTFTEINRGLVRPKVGRPDYEKIEQRAYTFALDNIYNRRWRSASGRFHRDTYEMLHLNALMESTSFERFDTSSAARSTEAFASSSGQGDPRRGTSSAASVRATRSNPAHRGTRGSRGRA
jgi:hypothetical protein